MTKTLVIVSNELLLLFCYYNCSQTHCNLDKALLSMFGFLNFGHCNLFVIWDLKFGISVVKYSYSHFVKSTIPNPKSEID